jgi:hypothetical protein
MNSTGLSAKARFYAEETLFAVRASRSLSAFRALMAETVRFHVANLKRTIPAPRAFRYDFHFGGKPASMTLRSHTGDITIFYEVFCREAYRLDRDRLDPAGVASIVDAGANVGASALHFTARYRNARIVAVEPNPENFALLVANTASEPRITPVQALHHGFAAAGGVHRHHGTRMEPPDEHERQRREGARHEPRRAHGRARPRSHRPAQDRHRRR